MKTTRSAATLFKALSDEQRLRIVALLVHGELCVCHIESALELPQPTISRHLATLRATGIVQARRAGTWMHYRLADDLPEAWRDQIKTFTYTAARDPALKRDLKRALDSKKRTSCP